MHKFDLFVSTIRAVIPHINSYIVAGNTAGFENMVAYRADNAAGLNLQGTQSLTTLQVGTSVIVATFPGFANHGFIISAVPRALESNTNLIRSLEMRSQTGILHDKAYSAWVPGDGRDFESTIADMSNGTPLDVLPGDWGYINDVGLFIILGGLRAAIGASSFCKLEFFGLDDLARLTSWNFEHRGPALDHRILDDEGEYNEIRLISPTIWEGMGSKSSGYTFDAKNGRLFDKEAYFEPTDPEQQGIFRQQTYRGYLGNGEKEYFALLSPNFSPNYLKYSDKSPYVGVLEINKALNGSYSIRSAKDITFEKTIIIPVPKELIIPEDGLGDNPDNYAAAGVLGDDLPDLAEYAPGLTAAEKVAALYDYHAYVFNKYNIVGFSTHKKDWHMPDEGSGDNSAINNLGFTETGIYNPGILSGFRYNPPTSNELTIDGRTNHKCKYYVSRSIFKQLDDGSILAEDGYGSQILMSQGNIFLTCPGDIFSLPGRSAITLAPKDIVQRAGSSVDITAAKGDVRLKAENNLHMLGGNSGTGGILIESKGSGRIQGQQFDASGEEMNAPGIVIKASDSDVYVYGKSTVYTGVTDENGVIINNTNGGTILTLAKTKLDLIEEASVTIVGDDDDSTFLLGKQGGVLSTQLVTDTLVVASKDRSSVAISGGLYVEDAILCKGQVAAVKAIVSETGISFAPVKPGTISDPAEQIQTKVDEAQRKAEDAVESVTSAADDARESLIDSDESPANENIIKNIAFTLRTDDNYDVGEDFSLYESRWQQLYRGTGAGTTWEEPPVTVEGKDDTYPYPGKAAWEDNSEAFVQVDLQNYDLAVGFSNSRDTINTETPIILKTTLRDGYLVTKQK